MTQSLLLKWATKTPADTLAIFETGTSWSYETALQRSWSFGRVLARLGVTGGEPVLAFLPNGAETLTVWFGANAIGAVFAPINTGYKAALLQHAINLPRAKVLVIAASHVQRLEGLQLPFLEKIIVVGAAAGLMPISSSARPVRWFSWNELEDEPPIAPDSKLRRAGDDMVYVYTSGTTGPSKAVRCSYRHHEVYTQWYGISDLHRTDRAYLCLPLFHVGGTGWLYTMLSLGASVAVVPRFVTEGYWDSVRRLRATTGTFMAAMAAFLINQPRRPDDADNPMRIATLVPYISQAEEFAERFAVKLWTGYAMSEVPGPLRTRVGAANLRSAGSPVSRSWRLRLVDDNGREVAQGQVGELLVKHESPAVITKGYLHMPDATSQAWAGGWFHTGDLMRRDADGEYYFVDRKKDALRRRGENISSAEVESEILAHPAVLEAAVVGIPAAEMEEDVMAFVALKPGQSLSERELFEFVIPRLPHFMVPRFIEIVARLPRSANEKVLKSQLKERGVSTATWDSYAVGLILRHDGLHETTPTQSTGP